jgi:GNAT superfamily N-acetyltransferase
MTDMTIRTFTPQDTGWLVDRHRALYAEADGFDQSFGDLVARILAAFNAGHDPARERGWVAERNGAPIGSIFCVGEGPRTAKLRLFLLEPEARGRGLGERLLATCMNFARDAGYAEMVLWTHESHRAACALYARTGWTMLSSKPVRSFGCDLVEQHWRTDL